MDPSPLPKNRRLAPDDLKARIRKMTPRPGRSRPGPAGGADQRADRGQHLRPGPRKNAQHSTAAPAWTPPRSRCSPAARPGAPGCAPATPTAAGTSARATTASARTTRESRCARSAWALEATIATTARPPGAPPACPNLAIGLALARPGEDPGGTGARVLASVAARGHKTGWLGYDRAYTQALPGRFHLPARALGYQPVMDYRDRPARHPGQHRRRHPGRGHLVLPRPARAADHRHHPPARPRHHPRPLRPADRRPRPYQLKRKDGPDTDGYQRLSCPALGRHPGLICPLRARPRCHRATGAPRSLQPPPEPPRICRQTAITIAPDIGARYRQDLPYGSPAWHQTYATLRNTIEGLNGYVKDPAHEALAQPGRRRVRGIAAQSLFTALLLMAANIRKIRAWRALTARDKTASPAGHGDAGPACATTSPTADTRTSSPRHRDHHQPGRPATPQAARSTPQHARRTPSQAGTATRASVRPRRHTKKQATATVLSV